MGGLFKSTTIKGTRITDFTQTEAGVGKPIPFGYGRFPVNGNVIWAKLPPKETRHVQKVGGKGGSTKQESFTYSTSYAIAVCLGPIYGYWWIKRNGKIVYSSDPNAPVEDQEYATKWLQKVTLHNGTMEQLPDSTIESVVGTGKVSAFKGLAYFVVEDDDVTETGGAVPSYEIVPIATAPEAYLTSKPYPQFYADEVGASFSPLSATLHQLLLNSSMQPDNTEPTFGPTSGVLKDVLRGEFFDSAEPSFGPTGGELIPPQSRRLVDATLPTFGPTDGVLFNPPLGKMKADDVTAGFGPTGGELLDPSAYDGLLELDDSLNTTRYSYPSLGRVKRISGASAHSIARSTTSHSSGKYFFLIELVGESMNDGMIGGIVSSSDSTGAGSYPGSTSTSYGCQFNRNYGPYVVHNGGYSYIASTRCGVGDVAMVAVDLDAGKVWFGRNGAWYGSGNPATGVNPSFSVASGTYYAAVSDYYAETTRDLYSGDSGSPYSPPSGFLPW